MSYNLKIYNIQVYGWRHTFFIYVFILKFLLIFKLLLYIWVLTSETHMLILFNAILYGQRDQKKCITNFRAENNMIINTMVT